MLQDSRYDNVHNVRNSVVQFKQQWQQIIMIIDIIFYQFDIELDVQSGILVRRLHK